MATRLTAADTRSHPQTSKCGGNNTEREREREREGLSPNCPPMCRTSPCLQWGTGGMATKLTAARIAIAAGTTMAILNCEEPEKVSTRDEYFLPRRFRVNVVRNPT
jgi:hypothetical protein